MNPDQKVVLLSAITNPQITAPSWNTEAIFALWSLSPRKFLHEQGLWTWKRSLNVLFWTSNIESSVPYQIFLWHHRSISWEIHWFVDTLLWKIQSVHAHNPTESVWVFLCMCVYVYACMCKCLWCVCTCDVFMHICICVNMCILCVYLCICVYIHVCIMCRRLFTCVCM